MRLYPVFLASFFLSLCLHAEEHSLSASQKEQETWQHILNSRYGALPEIVSPSTWDALSLLNAEYDSRAFSHESDLMIEGRTKLIHSFGTSALVAFVPENNTPFTGLFSAGAPYGILRVSLAAPPSSDVPSKLVPGLALKFFVDGRTSLNIMAMPSLDGQTDGNFFAFPFTTDVAEPAFSFKSWLIEQRFTSALSYVDQPDGNPRSFSLDHFAKWTSMGEEVLNPHAPFALMFVPTTDLQALTKAKCGSDFRVCLEAKGETKTLFDVMARVVGDSSIKRVGRIVAKSNFLASRYADESLFFQHPPVHTWDESTPKTDL